MYFPKLILSVLCYSQIMFPSNQESSFVQPGNGLTREIYYDFLYSNLNRAPDHSSFPDWPDELTNMDHFVDDITLSKQGSFLARYRAYYLAPSSGEYRFTAICNDQCRVYLGKSPNHLPLIIYIANRIEDQSNWEHSPLEQNSDYITLEKDYRYYIEFVLYGSGYKDYVALGIELPNKQLIRPLTQDNLLRSLDLYQREGMLVEVYNDLSNHNMVDLTSNSKFPDQPDRVFVTKTFSTSGLVNVAKTGLRFTGCLQFPQTGSYSFWFQCDEKCQLKIDDKMIFDLDKKDFDKEETYGPTEYTTGRSYCFEGLNVQKTSSGNFDMQIRLNKDSWEYPMSSSYFNVLSSDGDLTIIEPPVVVSESSTSLDVSWNDIIMPTRSNFILDHYEVVYQAASSTELQRKSVSLGSKSVRLDGLMKWTNYDVYVTYFGSTYNVFGILATIRTLEDVPENSPLFFTEDSVYSSAVTLVWNDVPFRYQNGIIIGYDIQFKAPERVDAAWETKRIDAKANKGTVNELHEFTVYQLQIAAVTSAGVGVFSDVVTVKTLEDKPSAPPEDITAEAVDATTLKFSYGQVKFDDQNGVITEYSIRYKTSNFASELRTINVNHTTFSIAINYLSFYTMYDISVAASTQIGIGPFSEVIQQSTKEHAPTAPPNQITGDVLSATSVRLQWNDIFEGNTHGEITAYSVRIKPHTPGVDTSERQFSEKSAIIDNLNEFTLYDFHVAGINKGGVGVYSSKANTLRTHESTPSHYPLNITAYNVSRSSVRINWLELPEDDRNGIITRYEVIYSDDDETWTSHNVGDPSQRTTVINNLKYFTLYSMRMFAATSVGMGPGSEIINVMTGESTPIAAPSNLTVTHSKRNSIVLSWLELEPDDRKGIIRGYVLSHKLVSEAGGTRQTLTIYGNQMLSGTIRSLEFYSNYTVKIKAFTSKGPGPDSEPIHAGTGEGFPIIPPLNFTLISLTGTSIVLTWAEVPTSKETNGVVLGYTVFYHVQDCSPNPYPGCNESLLLNVTVEDETDVSISGLHEYTIYNFNVHVLNVVGVGPPSLTITIRTDEGVPQSPPTNIQGHPVNDTEIGVFFNPIPRESRNGIILGYNITLRRINNQPPDIALSDSKISRHNSRNRRSILEPTYGDITTVIVNQNDSYVILHNLTAHHWYQITLAGFSSAGVGVSYTFNATCTQRVPLVAPDVFTIDKYSLDKITVSWGSITEENARGTVIGYLVVYYVNRIYDRIIPQKSQMERLVDYTVHSIELTGLERFSQYYVSVGAVTSAYVGQLSLPKSAETCVCVEQFSTNTYEFDPFLSSNGLSQDPIGILPEVLTAMVSFCCGECKSTQRPSIDWQFDSQRNSSLKTSRDSFLRGDADFNLPHSSRSLGSDDSDYIPVYKSPSSLIITKKPTDIEDHFPEVMAIVMSLLTENWRILFVILLLTVAVGCLMWILENNYTGDKYVVAKDGSHRGIWWSFVTITRIGYGDIVPSSMKGRLIACIWMLFAIFAYAFYTGIVTTAIMKYAYEDGNNRRSTKILRVAMTEESQRFAAKRFWNVSFVLTSSNQQLAASLLDSNEIDAIVIDSLTSGAFTSLVDESKFEIREIKDLKMTYGVSFDRNATQLKTCARRFIKQNKKEIYSKLAKIQSFQKLEKRSAFQILAFDLLHWKSPVFGIVIPCLIAFVCVFCMGGTAYHYLIYKKRQKVKKKIRDIIEEKFSLTNDKQLFVEQFIQSIMKDVKKREKTNMDQRIDMMKARGSRLISRNIVDIYGVQPEKKTTTAKQEAKEGKKLKLKLPWHDISRDTEDESVS